VHTHSQTYKISEIPSNENHVLRNLKQTLRLPFLQIVFELNERDTRVILKNLFSKPVWLFSFIGFYRFDCIKIPISFFVVFLMFSFPTSHAYYIMCT